MNRNFIVSQPDPNDNPKILTQNKVKNNILTSEMVKLILGLISLLFIIWIVWMIISVFYCIGKYQCIAIDVAFWSFPFFIGFISVIATLSFLLFIFQISKNIRYLDILGTRISRTEVDKYTPQVIRVAEQVAKSLATTGLDTYSPSLQTRQDVSHGKIDSIVEDTTHLLEGAALQDIQRHIN